MTAFAPMAQELATDRLRLRRRDRSDAAATRALWLERDHRALRRVDADGHPTVEEMADLVEAQVAESEHTGLSLLVLERHDDSAFLGYCGLIVGRTSLEEPEIAFELFREEQGKGYATEAGRAVVDAARATGRSRLWASVREWNAASLNVLTKLGFIDSGRRDPDVERGDTVWMTLAL